MMRFPLFHFIIINFLLLLLFFTISCLSTTSVELSEALSKAAGIYHDATKVRQYGLEKTVLVTACNHGFINHLFNFKCFLDRLQMKFLVIVLDTQGYHYLQQFQQNNNTSSTSSSSSMVTYLMTGGGAKEGQQTGEIITNQPTEFRSKQFNLITARKKEAVHNILQLGYNVLFSDTDVAILQDPIPYLLWKNVDYVHSVNDWCRIGDKFNLFRSKVEGNTGFYFVRSTNETIKLWADAFKAAPKYPRLDDQAIFWKVLRSSQDPPILPLEKCRHFDRVEDQMASYQKTTGRRYLTTCYLDTCIFSSGMLSRKYIPELTYEMLVENLKKMNERMVTVHANYISGNKKKMVRMMDYGLWLADNNPHSGAVEKGRQHSSSSSSSPPQCKAYVYVAPNQTVTIAA